MSDHPRAESSPGWEFQDRGPAAGFARVSTTAMMTDLYRLTLVWDVPEEAIDALVAEFEEVATKHGASMPDLWEEQRARVPVTDGSGVGGESDHESVDPSAHDSESSDV